MSFSLLSLFLFCEEHFKIRRAISPHPSPPDPDRVQIMEYINLHSAFLLLKISEQFLLLNEFLRD